MKRFFIHVVFVLCMLAIGYANIPSHCYASDTESVATASVSEEELLSVDINLENAALAVLESSEFDDSEVFSSEDEETSIVVKTLKVILFMILLVTAPSIGMTIAALFAFFIISFEKKFKNEDIKEILHISAMVSFFAIWIASVWGAWVGLWRLLNF